MTAKEYLLQYKSMTAKIATAESELSALRAASEGISSKIDGMPKGSGSRDRLAKLAVQIADREVELTELRAQALAVRDEIVDTLVRLTDPVYHRLLYLRYIQGYKWEAVAIELHYSYQWCNSELHDRALDALQELLDRT